MSCVKNEKISPYRLYNEAQNCNYILGDCATSRGDAWLWEIGEPVFVLTRLFSSLAMWIFWGRVQEALGWNFDQELVCATHLTVHFENFGLSKEDVSSVHLLHLWNLDYHNKKQNAEELGHKSNNPRKSDNSMQWFSDTFAASDQCFIFVNIGSNHTSSTFENTLQMDLSSDILLKMKLFQLFLRFEHLVEFFWRTRRHFALH